MSVPAGVGDVEICEALHKELRRAKAAFLGSRKTVLVDNGRPVLSVPYIEQELSKRRCNYR